MYLVEIRAHVSPTTRIPRSHLWPTSTCPFHLISQRLDMERSAILLKKKKTELKEGKNKALKQNQPKLQSFPQQEKKPNISASFVGFFSFIRNTWTCNPRDCPQIDAQDRPLKPSKSQPWMTSGLFISQSQYRWG